VRRLITLLAIVLLGLGALAGCGSGGNKTSAASAELEADNFYFKPTAFTLKAGQQAKIVVKNNGNVEHNLTVEDLGVKKDVEPGKSANVSVTPPAGTHPFHCAYHPDQMKGAITAE
jgi:plastocyanin